MFYKLNTNFVLDEIKLFVIGETSQTLFELKSPNIHRIVLIIFALMIFLSAVTNGAFSISTLRRIQVKEKHKK